MNINELKSVIIGILLTLVGVLIIAPTSINPKPNPEPNIKTTDSTSRYQYIGKEEIKGTTSSAIKDMEIIFDTFSF